MGFSKSLIGSPVAGQQRCAWTGFWIFWIRIQAASNRIWSEVFFATAGAGLYLDFVFAEETLMFSISKNTIFAQLGSNRKSFNDIPISLQQCFICFYINVNINIYQASKTSFDLINLEFFLVRLTGFATRTVFDDLPQRKLG